MTERERESISHLGHGDAARRRLESFADGSSRELKSIEDFVVSGIRVVEAERGRILCSFVVPNRLSDRDGNLHTGAIATVIDNVAAATVQTETGWTEVSVNFSISYFSTAKIDEEVEIEGRVLGLKGKLSSVIVEIRKKGSGQMVATGKQWMTMTIPRIEKSKL